MKSLLILLTLVGCGEVHGMPFGGEAPDSSGAGGTALVMGSGGSGSVAGTGGAAGGPAGSGGTAPASVGGSSGAMLDPSTVHVEQLPDCPASITDTHPVGRNPCGISADDHALYGCGGPCQFTDLTVNFEGTHVFGCVVFDPAVCFTTD